MVPIRLAIRPIWTLATLGLAALGLLALGCAAANPPQNAESVAAGARSAAETRTSPDLVHGLAVDGPEVGAEVGNRCPGVRVGTGGRLHDHGNGFGEQRQTRLSVLLRHHLKHLHR